MEKRYSPEYLVKNPGKIFATDDYDWALGIDSKHVLIYVYGEDSMDVVPYTIWDAEEHKEMFMDPVPGGDFHLVIKHLFEKQVNPAETAL